MNATKKTFKGVNKSKMYGSLIALCWATIALCLILKLLGSKQFEIPEYTYNINIWTQRFINYIFYMINSLAFGMLLVKRKLTRKEILIIICLFTPLYYMSLYSKLAPIKFVLEIVMYVILGCLLVKDKFWKILLECLLIFVLTLLYQIITMAYKNINIKIMVDNFIVDKILMIDYYTLIILTYLYASKKGGYLFYGYRRLKFLVVLSNKRRSKETLQQNLQKKSIEEESKGFKLFALMLAVFQFMLVFTLCYFINNTTWQLVVIFVSFCVLRYIFGKSYHCNSIINCTSLSCLIFVIATRLSLHAYISTLCNVIIGLLVAYLMYILYYFNKYTNSQGITLSRGMSLDALTEMCSTIQLTEMEMKILTDYYVKRKSLQSIAMAVGYSKINVSKIKQKAIKKIISNN